MIEIKHMRSYHWSAVAEIYQEGIATRMATFETEIPSWDQWNKNHIDSCRFVAIKENQIQGWAALSEVSSTFYFLTKISISIRKWIPNWFIELKNLIFFNPGQDDDP